jgi:hypothetical protein
MKKYLSNDVNTILILFFISVLTSIYLYNDPKIIDQSNTREIKVELVTDPYYIQSNGDNVPNISFKSKGYDNFFDISHCALDLINVDDILSLHFGDS